MLLFIIKVKLGDRYAELILIISVLYNLNQWIFKYLKKINMLKQMTNLSGGGELKVISYGTLELK